jgi:hypothetical protein
MWQCLRHLHPAQVNTHGSGDVFAFFLPPGAALVEVLPWNMLYPCLYANYADMYFKWAQEGWTDAMLATVGGSHGVGTLRSFALVQQAPLQ